MPERTELENRTKVMVVDDHALVTSALAGVLVDAGYEVATANNGADALKLAEQWKPQVVIMDVIMPGISGIETTERLLAAYPDIRVLMLSMTSEPDIVRRAMEAGAQAYMTKDVGVDLLLDALSQVIGGQTVMASDVANALLRESVPTIRLTERERQVLALVAGGLTAQQVARSLAISTRTTENHLAHIRSKVGVKNRAQLTRYAIEHRLDTYPDRTSDSSQVDNARYLSQQGGDCWQQFLRHAKVISNLEDFRLAPILIADLLTRGVFDKSHIHQASSARRLVIEATYSL
jgi:DNA-binding NarL/FixJ family response regulator